MSRSNLSVSAQLEAYLNAQVDEHPQLVALRERTANMEWAQMQISPTQGAFLQWLVKLTGAQRAIEVGVFTGYSALCTALALPEHGYLLACDIDEEWTRTAREAWSQASVAHKIQLVLAPASETLAQRLSAGESGTYDMAFIDADKPGYQDYFDKCVRLLRSGGVIVMDNMLWGGSVAERSDQRASTRALREVTRRVMEDRRVDASLVPIGDGLLMATKH